MGDRFAHQRERSEVQYPIEPLPRHALHGRQISQVGDGQAGAVGDGLVVAALEPM